MAISVVSELDQLLAVNRLLPGEVGLFRQRVEYTCLHACGDLLAVGSEQGYVWLLDIHAKKLIREIFDSKTTINKVRLYNGHSFIALGTSDGLLVVMDFHRPLAKTQKRERERSAVTALLWDDSGDSLFVGYASGKLLVFKFNRLKVHLEATPLLECGSKIISLSYSPPNLLVSSLNLPLLVNIETGASSQVGSRARKPGEYGGCFLSSGEAVVGRPGLRLWLTDNQGKVLSTSKYKEVLLDHSLPVIPLFGGVLLPLTLNNTWQLSSIQPLDDDWVAVSHGNTLLVLEPHSLACVGGISLGQSIVDMDTDRRSVYLLCKGHQRNIVKLSMPAEEPSAAAVAVVQSLLVEEERSTKDREKLVEEEIKEEVPIENEEQEKEELLNEKEGGENVERKKESEEVDKELEVEEKDENEKERDEDRKKEECMVEKPSDVTQISSIPDLVVAVVEKEEALLPDKTKEEDDVEKDGLCLRVNDSVIYKRNDDTTFTNCENSMQPTSQKEHEGDGDSVAIAEDHDHKGDEPLPATVEEEHEDGGGEENKEQDDQPGSQKDRSLNSPSLFTRARNIELKLGSQVAGIKSKLSSVGEQLIRPYTPVQDPTPSQPEQPPFVIITPVVSEEEAQRRARMAEIADDDDLVVHSTSLKVTRKKTKRRKKKQRLTPASSTHSSIEHIPEALENEVDDSVSPSVTPGVCENPPVTEPPASIPKDDNFVEDIGTLHKGGNNSLEHAQLERKEERAEEESKVEEMAPLVDTLDSPNRREIIDDDDQSDKSLIDECLLMVSSLSTEEKEENKEAEDEDEEITEKAEEEENKDEGTENEGQVTMRRSPFISRRRANALRNLHLRKVEELKDDNELLVNDANLLFYQPEGQKHSPDQAKSANNNNDHSKRSVTFSGSSVEGDHTPLYQSESDGEEEDRVYSRGSQVASDFYSMVGNLMRHTKEMDPTDILPSHRKDRLKTSFVSSLPKAEEEEEEKEKNKELTTLPDDHATHAGNIWTTISTPSGHHIQCVCLSSTSLWITDMKGSVFWSKPVNRELGWKPIKHPMTIISSSSSGNIVWGVYNGHVYARLGISDLNHAGSSWKNLTKDTPMRRQVKMVACDEKAVWMLMLDGRVFFRKEVSEGVPDGTVWREIPTSGFSFTQIACCDDIVWAVDVAGKSYVREGITPRETSGVGWAKVGRTPSLVATSVVSSGIVWGINAHSQLYFHCGSSSLDPAGCGPWWEATHSTLSKTTASSPTDSFLKLMSLPAERTHSLSVLTSMSSRISAGLMQRLLGIAACAQSGVCVLTSDSQLHACWGNATGYHYENICKDEIFNLGIWFQVEAGHHVPWVVRDDGELYCVLSNTRAEHIECQAKVTSLAASSSALWVVSKKQIWSRQGITASSLQGISWDYIELGTHMQELSIVKLAIGNRVAWALDHRGLIHFRFGIHPREPGTGMAPAWIPVDDNVQPFVQIAISPDDLIVWACDKNNNVYARIGVTSDFPVGTRWEVVPGEQAKQIAAANTRVFTLTPSGSLLSRHGVSESNPTGDYWRCVPGKFEKLSLNSSGHLVVINERGSVLQQKVKVMPLCSRRKSRHGTNPSYGTKGSQDLEKTVVLDEWEVL